MITSGRLLAERYLLTSRIAVGGMGEVWQANDTRLDRVVAVKILKAELSGDAEFLHRFRTEARTTAALNHAGIAAVHDYGEASALDGGDDSIAYLVMEYVDGEPLAGILARNGRIPADRLLPILEQAGRALHAAHARGLVHRDVKPGNILVMRGADGTETVKITDFGVAKAADAAPVTRNGMVMGTAHYIAPEQAIGHEAEPASDVYSLGVCGYECLTGYRPFLSENAVTVAMMHIRDTPPPLPPDVPPTVRALIESTLVKDPSQRYRDGSEFAGAVATVRAGGPPPLPSGLARPAASPTVPPGSRPGLHPVPVPYQQAARVPVTDQYARTPPSGSVMPHGAASSTGEGGRVWPWVIVAIVTVLLIAVAVIVPLALRGDSGPPTVTESTTESHQQGTRLAPVESGAPSGGRDSSDSWRDGTAAYSHNQPGSRANPDAVDIR
ncbi:serine/threonine protein kinase [Haloechinothrix alba]|uniref:non-specific serine/threonine protein kinase n=1 Tax=Haloechinothrix alba TaxID=664784 RepID=A0A238V2A3_9PSEU|nr:protein kinase [Haloechinothrix alba]SNR28137.1 serine/threonine protein kinase [Haloechinothrix alba]